MLLNGGRGAVARVVVSVRAFCHAVYVAADEALKDEADGGTAATTAKPHRRGRVYSGAERAAAADVHRAHALCLLGRALLLDAAASDEALQAELLSLLPPQLAADAASAAAAEAPTADSWLPSLIQISEPTRLMRISYAVFGLKKKKNIN